MNNNILNSENGSMSVLDIGKALDTLDPNDRFNYLKTCISKLSPGGSLSFYCTHLDSFCKNYLFGGNFNNTSAILNLKSTATIEETNKVLQAHHVKITSLNINNGFYFMTVTK